MTDYTPAIWNGSAWMAYMAVVWTGTAWQRVWCVIEDQ